LSILNSLLILRLIF